MKKLLTILLMLIAFTSYSQNTIQITKNQAKQAIRTAQKLETANKLLKSKDVVILSQKRIIADNNLIISNLNKEVKIKDKNTFRQVLIIAVSFGLGYLIGK